LLLLVLCQIGLAEFEYTSPLKDLKSDFAVTEGAITGLVSITDGTAVWSLNNLSGFGEIEGTVLSDSVLRINGGSITSGVSGSFSGTLTAGTLTDGILSISSGSITSAVTGTFSGTLTAGTLTDGTLIATGGVITTGIWNGDAITVPYGGTGATSLTEGGLLVGGGTGAVTALSVASNGQLPIGDGTTAPTLATLTATANETEITNGTGSITIGLPNDVTIGNNLTVTNTALIDGTLSLGTGSITDTTSAIDFDDENLTTTGAIQAENFHSTDDASVADTLVVGGTCVAGTLTDETLSITGGDLTTTGTGRFDGGIGIGADPTYLFDILMSATDTVAIGIDGTTNDYTGTGAAYKYAMIFERDLNCGAGNDPPNFSVFSLGLFPKHAAGCELLGTRLARCQTCAVEDTTSVYNNTSATNRISIKQGLGLSITDSATYTSTGAGYIRSDNYGIKKDINFTPTFSETGGADSNLNVYGDYTIVNTNPAGITGDLIVKNFGQRVDVTGTTEGTSFCYGYYVGACTGADVNYAYYNATTANNMMGSVGSKSYFGDTDVGIYSQADSFLDLFADGGIRIGDSSAGAPYRSS